MIFPNPFSQNATIKISPPGNKISNGLNHLRIYDLPGRFLREYISEKSEFKIERGDLNSGIYFYSVSQGNQEIGKGKFVIQ